MILPVEAIPGRQGAGLPHRPQQLQRLREAWKEYFKVPPSHTIGTTGLLVKDTLVEIDLIGVAND
jgi:enamine deaminase RidA (YjgF/YER057c/UK114 family)